MTQEFNYHNLERLIKLLYKVPKTRFNMEHYREDGDYQNLNCKTSGCVIGWSSLLYEKYDDIPKIRSNYFGPLKIDFDMISLDLFGIKKLDFSRRFTLEFDFLFGLDNSNSIKQAQQRIRYFIDNQGANLHEYVQL